MKPILNFQDVKGNLITILERDRLITTHQFHPYQTSHRHHSILRPPDQSGRDIHGDFFPNTTIRHRSRQCACVIRWINEKLTRGTLN